MKLSKWNEKVHNKLDDLTAGNGAFYCNRDDGVLFTDKSGAWLLFCPGVKMLSANGGKNNRPLLNEYWDRTIRGNGQLSESSEAGTLNGEKVHRFSAGDTVVYCADKFLRQFPKNTLFYVESMTRPVTAGIWENGQLTIIGLIMPVFPRSEFVPA